MGFNEMLGDSQTETHAARIGRFVKTFKNVLQILGRNARTVILHDDQDVFRIGFTGQPDSAARRRVTQIVGKKVGEHLSHAAGIDFKQGQVAGHIDGYRHPGSSLAMEDAGDIAQEDSSSIGSFFICGDPLSASARVRKSSSECARILVSSSSRAGWSHRRIDAIKHAFQVALNDR
jgi:hypothetical protein